MKHANTMIGVRIACRRDGKAGTGFFQIFILEFALKSEKNKD
ncbi:MAG: hypothetical protein ACTSWN_05705 [Promethearchaeota archaeon]